MQFINDMCNQNIITDLNVYIILFAEVAHTMHKFVYIFCYVGLYYNIFKE